MFNKKVIILVGAVLIATVTAVFLYFKYWREPQAKYLESDNLELIHIRKDLAELKSDLKKRGLYDCCIRNDCNWCALYMGHCPCANLVTTKGNERSCPECAAAWNRKQGRFPGVDPDAIKVTTFGIYGFEKEGHHHEGGHRH